MVFIYYILVFINQLLVRVRKVGWALRAAGYGYAVARLEQGSKAHTSLGEKTKWPHKGAILFSGGEGGIRTHGTGDRTPDFESGPFDHSGTSP